MKKIFALLALALVFTLSATAKSKVTVIEKPAFAFTAQNAFVPENVTLTKTSTTVRFKTVHALFEWSIAPTARLVADGKVLPVISGTAYQVPSGHEKDEPKVEPFVCGQKYFGHYGAARAGEGALATINIDLVFPALPKGTKVITFDEGVDNPEQFCVSGIRLDGNTYPTHLTTTDAKPFTWTASTTPSEAKTGHIFVKVIGDELPAQYSLEPGFFSLTESPFQQSLTEPTWQPATDGTIGGTVTVTNAVPTACLVYLRNSRNDVYTVPCIPGENITLTVDYNALTRLDNGGLAEGEPYYTLTTADGRQVNTLTMDGQKVPDRQLFTASDLQQRATNPDAAAQRLAERKAAEDLLNRINALEDVTEAEVNAIAPAYQPIIKAKHAEALDLKKRMAEGKGGKVCEVPDVPAADLLKTIAAKYKGKVVYMDLWATWCGPCKNGIKAMKPHHDDFSSDDVQFVYITNESSPLDKWNTMLVDMPGDHYRLKSFEGIEPAVSGIPRYFMFDREGNIILDQAGFGPGMELEFCKKIQEAVDKK